LALGPDWPRRVAADATSAKKPWTSTANFNFFNFISFCTVFFVCIYNEINEQKDIDITTTSIFIFFAIIIATTITA
jgi:hypothetical protein